MLGSWTLTWRRHWRQSLVISSLCLLPMLPCIMLWQATGTSTGSSSSRALYHWETPQIAWDHFRLHFASFDRSWGRSSHQLLLVLALGTMVAGVFPDRASERRLFAMFVLTNLFLLVVVPLEIKTSQGLWARLLNVRYLLFVEFGLLLLAGRLLAHVGQDIVQGAIAALLLVFLGHLHRYVYRFQAHAAPLQ